MPRHATQITRSKAERWGAMRERMDSVVRKLAAAHPDETILLVTHGGPIEAVCPALDPRVSKGAEIQYTCLSVFHADEAAPKGFTCTLHACAAHAGL
jgi:broad specificity phosphatase PhoE